MKNVAKIIADTGGLAKLRERALRIEASGFMALCIEHLGPSPHGRGLIQISVAHYGEQNGDMMRDPDIVFDVNESDDDEFGWRSGNWRPVSFRNDYVGLYQEAVYVDEAGKVLLDTSLIAKLRDFTKLWDRNIRDQGFVKAAKCQEERT